MAYWVLNTRMSKVKARWDSGIYTLGPAKFSFLWLGSTGYENSSSYRAPTHCLGIISLASEIASSHC